MNNPTQSSTAGQKFRVREVTRETPDAITLVFDPMDENFHYRPGQYYVCVPAGMEKAIVESLKFIGVPETNIYLESY